MNFVRIRKSFENVIKLERSVGLGNKAFINGPSRAV